MGMIESLLPNSDRMQNVLFMKCLHLAELSQKQEFMAGFTFALEVMRTGKTGSNRVTARVVAEKEKEHLVITRVPLRIALL